MKYCTKCGAALEDDAKFCNKCGSPIENSQENTITAGNKNKNEDIGGTTQAIKMNNTAYNDSRNAYKQDDYYEIPKKRKKHNKVVTGIIAGVAIIAVIVCSVFFNKISGAYYAMKSKDAVIETEKVDYAVKAVKAYDSENNKKLLKDTLIDVSKDDLDLAEEKLKQISSILNEADVKSISTDIKEKKVDNYCSKSQYEEALSEFVELNKLGVDFKSNKHYDDVMLNVISKLTGTPVKSNKDALMEDNFIAYDNFDDDEYDEIIEVKNGDSYRYSNSDIKLNLYKFKDGKYKLTDTKTITASYNKTIQGVYNYAQDKKGLYLGYNSRGALNTTSHATAVYGVDNERLSLKGIVYGNDYTKPDDNDNDGIYEVLSSSKSYASSTPKQTKKWYSIHEDGSLPTEIGSSGDSTSNTAGEGSNDYILPTSNTTYLMEEDMRGLSKDKLALARNEIFARHGYVFKEEPYKSYFEGKSWYTKNPNFDGSDSYLNKYEIANYKLIQDWEKK